MDYRFGRSTGKAYRILVRFRCKKDRLHYSSAAYSLPFSSVIPGFAYGISSTSHLLYRRQAVCNECAIVGQRLHPKLALPMDAGESIGVYLVQ